MKQKILLLAFAGCCLLCSCGTTGRIRFYDYTVSKDSLQAALKQFLAADPGYSFPKGDSAWRPYTPKDSITDYTVPDEHMAFHYKDLTKVEEYIYFKNKREEVYQLRYYGNDEYWRKNPYFSRLMLIGVVKKGGKWRYSDPVFNTFFRGRKRVEKRLETEVLNKLPYKFEKVSLKN